MQPSTLKTLNALLGQLMQQDPATAAHIHRAAELAKEDFEAGTGAEMPSAEGALNSLAAIYQNLGSEVRLEAIDLAAQAPDPLWTRAQVQEKLRLLSGYPAALLLVLGLRQHICHGKSMRWTAKRQAEYTAQKDYIEELAAQYTAPSTQLTLLFI